MPTTGKLLSDLYKITIGGTEITNLTSASVEWNTDTRDVTTKDSGGLSEILPTTYSSTMSFEAIVALDAAEGLEELYDDLKARTAVTVVMTTGVTGDVQWSSSGYLTALSMEAGTQDNVTMSGTITLTGDTTKSDVA